MYDIIIYYLCLIIFLICTGLAKCKLITPEFFEEIFEYVLEECHCLDVTVKSNAIAALGRLISMCQPYPDGNDTRKADSSSEDFKCILSIRYIEGILPLVLPICNRVENNLIHYALFCTSNFILKRFILAVPDKIPSVLNEASRKCDSMDTNVRISALSCCSAFISQNLLNEHQLRSLLTLLLRKLEERESVTMAYVLRTLSLFLSNKRCHPLAQDKVNAICHGIMRTCGMHDEKVNGNAYYALGVLASRFDLKSSLIGEVLNTVLIGKDVHI